MSPSVEPFDEVKYNALMDGLECSEVSKSKLERTLRIDSEYFSKKAIDMESLLGTLPHVPLTSLVDVSDGNHSGISEKFADTGIPYYRGQDAGTFFIESTTPICIDEETYNTPIMRRSHLKKNDVLLSIVGTIGSLSLVYSDRQATCSCKLAILRPKDYDDAEFLAVFLNSKYGQMQIARFTRGAVQKGLILEDMDQLVVPSFGVDFKKEIKQCIMGSYELNNSAQSLLDQSQNILLSFLDINTTYENDTTIAIKKFSDSFDVTHRLDAEYYQPKYDKFFEAIDSCKNGYSTIKKEFDHITQKCDRTKQEYLYVEIGDINVGSGEASFNCISTDLLPANAKIMTRKGDVIVSTVRPNRGAVAILDSDNLLVSGAFTVLREKGTYKKEVLQSLLRTKLYRDWLMRYNVGTSYPVIKCDDILSMPIPLFDDSTQSSIVDSVRNAFALRRKSKELLENAKKSVEMAIEQGEEVALSWLKNQVN